MNEAFNKAIESCNKDINKINIISQLNQKGLDFYAVINKIFSTEEMRLLADSLISGNHIQFNIDYTKLLKQHNAITIQDYELLMKILQGNYDYQNIDEELLDYARERNYYYLAVSAIIRYRDVILLPSFIRYATGDSCYKCDNIIYEFVMAKDSYVKRYLISFAARNYTYDQMRGIREALNNDVPIHMISNRNYSGGTIIEISRAWRRGIDITPYALENPYSCLPVIADVLEDGLDPAPMLGRGLSSGQMNIIHMAMKEGLNYGWYLNPMITYEKMYNLMLLQKMGENIVPYCDKEYTGPMVRKIREEKERKL